MRDMRESLFRPGFAQIRIGGFPDHAKIGLTGVRIYHPLSDEGGQPVEGKCSGGDNDVREDFLTMFACSNSDGNAGTAPAERHAKGVCARYGNLFKEKLPR